MRNLNFLFSNSVQGESDLTRYCPRDAFEMPLTCPRHLFHKMLILSMLLFLGIGNVWGADVTYIFSSATNNPGSGNDWYDDDIDAYTSWEATDGTAHPKYYSTGTGLRVYNGGKFTINSTKTMSSIKFTFSSNSYTFRGDISTTPYTVTPNATSWEVSVNRAHCCLQKIEITYAAATAHTVRFYTASGTYTNLTEASAGAGVTPPTMSTPCDGWAFQGWSKSQSTSSTSTTVLSTETLTDGKYYPNADITLYPVYTKEVEETTIISDVLTNSTTGISGTTYTAWSNKTSNSDAVYAGKSAGQYTSIQLNSSSPNGFWTTSSGGIAKKVIVEWNSNTANARVLQIFGKSSAYASGDLYSSTPATKGTNIGTITKGTTTEVTLSADYAYIGLRSSSSALYLDKVTIQWETEVTTTYYYSYPTCCTELGSINGSIFLTKGKSLVRTFI